MHSHRQRPSESDSQENGPRTVDSEHAAGQRRTRRSVRMRSGSGRPSWEFVDPLRGFGLDWRIVFGASLAVVGNEGLGDGDEQDPCGEGAEEDAGAVGAGG